MNCKSWEFGGTKILIFQRFVETTIFVSFQLQASISTLFKILTLHFVRPTIRSNFGLQNLGILRKLLAEIQRFVETTIFVSFQLQASISTLLKILTLHFVRSTIRSNFGLQNLGILRKFLAEIQRFVEKTLFVSFQLQASISTLLKILTLHFVRPTVRSIFELQKLGIWRIDFFA